MRNFEKGTPCALCVRKIPEKKYAEKHHLTPKAEGGKETVIVCCPCADQIHQLFTNKELRDKYNTIKALLSDSRVRKWVRWIRKTDKWYVRMRSNKRDRKR